MPAPDEQSTFSWVQPMDSQQNAPVVAGPLGTMPTDTSGGPYHIARGPLTPNALLAWVQDYLDVDAVEMKPIGGGGPPPQPPLTRPHDVVGPDDFVYRPTTPDAPPVQFFERREMPWRVVEQQQAADAAPGVQVEALWFDHGALHTKLPALDFAGEYQDFFLF